MCIGVPVVQEYAGEIHVVLQGIAHAVEVPCITNVVPGKRILEYSTGSRPATVPKREELDVVRRCLKPGIIDFEPRRRRAAGESELVDPCFFTEIDHPAPSIERRRQRPVSIGFSIRPLVVATRCLLRELNRECVAGNA